MVDRAARSGTIIGWRIDRVFGTAILRGTVIRPHEVHGRVPDARPIALRLLWHSHGVFGCTDGTSQGSTHTFREG